MLDLETADKLASVIGLPVNVLGVSWAVWATLRGNRVQQRVEVHHFHHGSEPAAPGRTVADCEPRSKDEAFRTYKALKRDIRDGAHLAFFEFMRFYERDRVVAWLYISAAVLVYFGFWLLLKAPPPAIHTALLLTLLGMGVHIMHKAARRMEKRYPDAVAPAGS